MNRHMNRIKNKYYVGKSQWFDIELMSELPRPV
jgi:hypothetical protein